MKKNSTATDLMQQIANSAGTDYLNRAHQRSFSLNIFQMNAVELMEAAQKVKDPEQGMSLMMEKNREAGRQAHRELSRHVHNFVSSALTLVEHTRVFMRKQYANTDLLVTYEKQVKATFMQSPVAHFVQGLRNYMLHRGLPNSSMFMKFESNPAEKGGAGTAETGIYYDTVSLLDWKGWKPEARNYLEQVGEHLDLYEFTQEYLTLVNQFHGWLDATLAAHHQLDLQELNQLQAQLEAISPRRSPVLATTVDSLEPSIIGPFEFTSIQTTELNQISSEILNKVRELHFQKTNQGFPTERPAITISESERIGPVAFWGMELSGERAFSFINHNDKPYGLLESDYRSLDGLVDVVMSAAWTRTSLSRAFIENTFCNWVRLRYAGDASPFHEALCTSAKDSVKAVEIWAPVASLEVEQRFDFGPVRFEPITTAVITNLRNRVTPRPEYEEQISQFFEKLRHEIQGYAAAVISMEAEPVVAQERALRIAQDAVGLLRFFSPAASASYLFSPVALSGAEYIPTSKLIVLGEGSFRHHQGVLPKMIGYWRLAKQQIRELKSGLLDTAASLVIPEGLSEFALNVRASLLTYSKGTTLVDPLDRLHNCLSAIEGVLLRHEMEPRAHSVANRISFLLAQGGADREAIKQIVRKIYWLLGQSQVTAIGHREEQLIMVFTSYAYHVLHMALGNIANFSFKVEFVIEVDRLGLST